MLNSLSAKSSFQSYAWEDSAWQCKKGTGKRTGNVRIHHLQIRTIFYTAAGVAGYCIEFKWDIWYKLLLHNWGSQREHKICTSQQEQPKRVQNSSHEQTRITNKLQLTLRHQDISALGHSTRMTQHEEYHKPQITFAAIFVIEFLRTKKNFQEIGQEELNSKVWSRQVQM